MTASASGRRASSASSGRRDGARGLARGEATDATPLLGLNNIEVLYDDVILVLRGLSLEVAEGRIAALLGSNGAGKTTTLKAISGLLHVENGEVSDGTIVFDGEEIQGMDAHRIVERGVFQVLEGRRVFEHLTVRENLLAGAYTRGTRRGLNTEADRVYHYFPALAERRRQLAGHLSGGEQQMLALGRALMASPRMMLLDEPSLGLAPMLVESIFEIVRRINREEGTTILLVEQNARIALAVADYGYIMEGGSGGARGRTAEELRANEDVKEFYLGLGDGRAAVVSGREALSAAQAVAVVRGSRIAPGPASEAFVTGRDAGRGGARAGREEGTPPGWAAMQDRLAARAVAHGAEHGGEIRRRLAGAGVSVRDVGGVADLRAVPVLAKDDLPALQAADPPFGGMLAVPPGSLARIHRSPGPINDPEGADDGLLALRPGRARRRLPPRRRRAEQLFVPPDAGRPDARWGTARGGVRGDRRGRGGDHRPDRSGARGGRHRLHRHAPVPAHPARAGGSDRRATGRRKRGSDRRATGP